MKKVIKLLIAVMVLISCENKKEVISVDAENWKERVLSRELDGSLISGTTYLSIYSQIYNRTEHRTHDLVATVSMRNTNRTDSVFIEKVDYFNTKGDLIRSYINKPIYIGPMETVEIVIDELDRDGGTGANFLFDWKMNHSSNEPFFEAIMISTSMGQGLSFTTQGKKLK
ncbi:DUF3124 domain-containing protein [Urechidicola vernalis]|uniref:DUF3124 domain-containing protein n=1 Tax=Urechidicola vernalis TaxID=3075600 RepID=A0ABU2Y4A4_9FLAO|nr:DUF3124 domain-containing protein [Urechidicola sp. P050]MDT0553024.1 DUF3124 domain-containing protein [Urechidicola sp. P050]